MTSGNPTIVAKAVHDLEPFWYLQKYCPPRYNIAVHDTIMPSNHDGAWPLPIMIFTGALPLRGSIPDMTSDSDRYIQLQQVYREQADIDDAIVTQKVHDLLQSIGRVSMVVPCMNL